MRKVPEEDGYSGFICYRTIRYKRLPTNFKVRKEKKLKREGNEKVLQGLPSKNITIFQLLWESAAMGDNDDREETQSADSFGNFNETVTQ